MTGLDLPENVGLADHQAIERGGHGEDMADGVLAGQHIERSVQVLGRQPRVRGHQRDDASHRGLVVMVNRLDLDPVAGRHDQRLFDPGTPQAIEQARHGVLLDEKLVANR